MKKQLNEIKRLQQLAGILTEAIVDRQFLGIDEGHVFMVPSIKVDSSSRSKTFDLLLKVLSGLFNERLRPHELELIIPKAGEVRVLPMIEMSQDAFQIAKLDSPEDKIDIDNSSDSMKCIIMLGEVAFIAVIDKATNDDEIIENVYEVLQRDMAQRNIDIDDIILIDSSKFKKITCYQIIMSGNII